MDLKFLSKGRRATTTSEQKVFGLTNVVLLFVAVFVIVSYYNKWLTLLPDPAQLLLKEIAFAVIVALVLIYTIEKSNREKHERAAEALIEKINSDLFHAIYKRSIPADVFGEVEKCLLRATVHRTDYEITYVLKRLRDFGMDHDYVFCEAESTYKLTNITDAVVRHPVTLLVEMPLDKKMSKYCRIERVEVDGKVLEHKELDELVEPSDIQMQFMHEVDIPARGSIRVGTKASLVKRTIDEEIWHSIVPTSGITLTVITPEDDLDVNAVAFHSEKLVKTTDVGVSRKWKLEYGIFPHQALAFWWKPKEAAQAARVV